jgi:hypothetical protein
LKLTTAKDIEKKQNADRIRKGLAAILVILVLGLIPYSLSEGTPQGPERLPPAPKSILFRITPRNLKAIAIVLTDSEAVQQVIPPATYVELELAGKVFWTVQSPGYQAATGSFEVPYGPAEAPVEISVKLISNLEAARKRQRSGSIQAGGKH